MLKVKTITALLTLLLLLVLIQQPIAAAIWRNQDSQDAAAGGRWPSIAEIEGKAWIVYDCQTGKVLLEHEADTAMYPASTTKIMTAILILESDRLDEMVTVSATAVKLPSGSSKVGLIAGEQIIVHDALAGLMLASGNDAANALAEAYAGSIEAFASVMNQKAAEIGMTGSHFSNPSGLHDITHVMTARDMAILAAYALKNTQFCELISTTSYSMPATNKHPYPGWGMFNNTNRFLQFGETAMHSDWLDHYEGIKTGSTDAAGNNLVAAAVTKSGHRLVSVLFGVPLTTKIGNPYIYSRTLLEAAASQLGAAPTATPAATTAVTGISPAASPSASAVTSATNATTAQSVTGAEPASIRTLLFGKLWRENPWRTSFLVLLPVTVLLGLLVVLLNQKIRRLKIRPRRVKPGK